MPFDVIPDPILQGESDFPYDNCALVLSLQKLRPRLDFLIQGEWGGGVSRMNSRNSNRIEVEDEENHKQVSLEAVEQPQTIFNMEGVVYNFSVSAKPSLAPYPVGKFKFNLLFFLYSVQYLHTLESHLWFTSSLRAISFALFSHHFDMPQPHDRSSYAR